MKTSAARPSAPLTMAQVTAAPLTGLTHVSTFSGAGGSCLGFRLAGFLPRCGRSDIRRPRARLATSANPPRVRSDGARHPAPLTAAGLSSPARPASPPARSMSSRARRPVRHFPLRANRQRAGTRPRIMQGTSRQANVERICSTRWLRLLGGAAAARIRCPRTSAGLVKRRVKRLFQGHPAAYEKALGYRTEARHCRCAMARRAAAAMPRDLCRVAGRSRRGRPDLSARRGPIGIPCVMRYRGLQPSCKILHRTIFDSDGDKRTMFRDQAWRRLPRAYVTVAVQNGAYPSKYSSKRLQ